MENLLKKTRQRALYVGLLPLLPVYFSTILAHKIRRPAEWGLFEPSGDLIRDLQYIVRQSKDFDAVLLDGPTPYLRRLSALGLLSPQDKPAARHMVKQMAESGKTYYFIDVPCSDDACPAVRFMHQWVSSLARSIHAVTQGVENPPLIEKELREWQTT